MSDNFDYVVDRLINSELLERWMPEVVYAHSDNLITEEQVNFLFDFPSAKTPRDPINPDLQCNYPELHEKLADWHELAGE